MEALNKKEIKKLFKESPKRTQEIVLMLENIQYARNVASIFRTADAAGVNKMYLAGISQHPPFGKELKQVSRSKERSVHWEAVEKDRIVPLLQKLKSFGYYIVAIEIADEGKPIAELPKLLKGKDKIVFIAGSEVFGVTKTTMLECDAAVYIPMYGRGGSLNVSASVAIALYSF